MTNTASCIKDSNDFINKVKNIDIPNDRPQLLNTSFSVNKLYLNADAECGYDSLSIILKQK